MSSGPYQEKNNSSRISELKISSIKGESGGNYKTFGYIELFEPNYFVIVGAADQRDLSQDIAGASAVAQAAVQRFDCKQGTEIKGQSTYDAGSNQWLIVVDCKNGGRQISGS